MDSTLNGNKGLEPGYVFVPYIMVQTSSTIVDPSFNNRIRKNKINKIYNLALEIDSFPSKSMTSRYSSKTINSNYYGKVEIK